MRTPKDLPSASSLQLASTCAASQALGVVDSKWASGEAGTEKHLVLADWATSPEGAEFKLSTEMARWLDSVAEEAAELRSPDTEDEVSFTWSPVTGKARRLGRRLSRSYEAVQPDEYVGTVDYVRHDAASGCVRVVDLKTGMAEVPHPSRNMQLRFAALAVARYYGVEVAHVAILHAPEGRAPWWERATLEAFDLGEVEFELRALAERIGYARADVAQGKTPRLRVGEHCTYCPARHGCPSRVAMAKRLSGAPEEVVMDLKAQLTPETAALALARWQAATKALKEVGDALYAYASETPIALGDGRMWGPREVTREVIDADKAWPVLVAKYGVRVAEACVSMDTSKAGVERGMRVLRESMRGAEQRPPGVPPGKATIKSLHEDALATLRAAGCVTTKTSKTFDTYALELPSND